MSRGSIVVRRLSQNDTIYKSTGSLLSFGLTYVLASKFTRCNLPRVFPGPIFKRIYKTHTEAEKILYSLQCISVQRTYFLAHRKIGQPSRPYLRDKPVDRPIDEIFSYLINLMIDEQHFNLLSRMSQ